MPRTVVSLFAGCGGFDSGFAAAGFRTISAFDYDAVAVATYNSNLRPIAARRDLRLDTSDIPRADIVLAGPPCQGFSTVGKQSGKDERNDLLGRACEIASLLRPSVFVLENVPGVTQSRHSALLSNARRLLSDAGYFVSQAIVECKDLGVVQRRKRFFLIARSRQRPFHIALPKVPMPPMMELIGGAVDDTPELSPQTVAGRIAARIKPGQKLCNVRVSASSIHTWDVPDVFGETTARERTFLNTMIRLRRSSRKRNFGDADPVDLARIESAFGESMSDEINRLLEAGYLRMVGDCVDLTNTFNGKYRRLDWAAPAPTVDTKFGQPQLFLHPSRNRGLSSWEAARLQGFPATYRLPARATDAFRVVGNAVPPPVALNIAKLVAGLSQ